LQQHLARETYPTHRPFTTTSYRLLRSTSAHMLRMGRAAALVSLLLFLPSSSSSSSSSPPDLTLSVSVSASFRTPSPLLFSAFLEDINHALVGGLHGELVADAQVQGPTFVGASDDTGGLRHSLQALAVTGGEPFYLRWCGTYLLTADGTGDATFLVESPGLTGSPGTVSFVTLLAPNTGSAAGSYLVAAEGAKGGAVVLTQQASPSPATSSFNASATWTLTPGDGGAVTLSSLAPWALGWTLESGPEMSGDSGACTWVGTRYGVAIVPPAAPVPSSPPKNATWALAAPLQPSQLAWTLVPSGSQWDGYVSGAFTSAAPAPLNANTTSFLRVDILKAGWGAGVCNSGFYGIGVPAGASSSFNATFSVLVDAAAGFRPGADSLHITIESADGGTWVYAAADVPFPSVPRGTWAEVTATLTVPATNPHEDAAARFCVRPSHATTTTGSFFLGALSLMPLNTFHGRANGMRADLAEMVAAIQPAALRFPGGCFVEGLNATTAVNFTRGVGPVSTRVPQYNMWQYENNNRAGLFELLQFTEDIGAQPIYVVNVGLYYGGGADPVGPWIDHALDALEFAMGDPATTYWGGVRASMGRAEPFPIAHLALGNENYGSAYATEHYTPAYQALRAAYPNASSLTLIATENVTAPGVAPVELFDFHLYPPVWDMIAMQFTFDGYDRAAAGATKIFNSEYASKDGAGRGNVLGAVAEAVWMVGLERNSDILSIACYAPLFARAEDEDWLPDAIIFDSLRAYGTPSYWVQRLFAPNRGTPGATALVGYNVSASAADQARYGAGTPAFAAGLPLASDAANFSVSAALDMAPAAPQGAPPTLILKLVNFANASRTLAVDLVDLPPGLSQPATGTLATVASPTGDPLDENSFADPERVTIVEATVPTGSGAEPITLPPFSVHVLRLELR
jgi:alpha-L-arabinofuranosidase